MCDSGTMSFTLALFEDPTCWKQGKSNGRINSTWIQTEKRYNTLNKFAWQLFFSILVLTIKLRYIKIFLTWEDLEQWNTAFERENVEGYKKNDALNSKRGQIKIDFSRIFKAVKIWNFHKKSKFLVNKL